MLKVCARLLFPLLLFLLFVVACQRERTVAWQGYAEGEYVYVATPRAGRLLELAVHKGETVAAGTLLYRLDPEPEVMAVTEARQRLESAGFRRDDAAKGERPSEIAALEAQRTQAVAARDLAQTEFSRRERLLSSGIIPREEFDRSRTTLQERSAAVIELNARLTTARLGSRSNQQQALGAERSALAATLQLAQWNLAQKSPLAVESGLVFDTLFQTGEWVPAGTPVVVLLPASGRKALFYVPEPQLASLAPGNRVKLRFDGNELLATISYISPQAEYTPPVIYSRDSRSKLVYLIEARPDAKDAPRLKPGQPLEVVAE